ncbi:uncharacterized protein [Triticum aestivum]|uniref:uncharacterized protein isoform X2 n=1 Tax=Triticum aestivum TaxID=4565 RepID=UPI001D001D0A|nr:uncharacterized protein LOC123082267 isoform X2 [Triticum aestivum]
MAFIAVLAAWKAPSSLHLRLGSTRQPQQANSRNGPKKLDPSNLLQWNRPEPETPMVRGDGGAGETMNRRAHMGGRQIDGGAGEVITMSHHRWTLPEQSSKLADFNRKRVTHRPHKQYEEPGKKYKLATKDGNDAPTNTPILFSTKWDADDSKRLMVHHNM